MTYEQSHICDICGKEKEFGDHDVRRLSVSAKHGPTSDGRELVALDYCENHSAREVAMALAMSLVNTDGIIPDRWTQSDDDSGDEE